MQTSSISFFSSFLARSNLPVSCVHIYTCRLRSEQQHQSEQHDGGVAEGTGVPGDPVRQSSLRRPRAPQSSQVRPGGRCVEHVSIPTITHTCGIAIVHICHDRYTNTHMCHHYHRYRRLRYHRYIPYMLPQYHYNKYTRT